MSKPYNMLWEEVETLCDQLAQVIDSQFKHHSMTLVAVPRGGLIPATLIAHRLKNTVGTICNYNAFMPTYPGTSILIDDIYDTGTTMESILNQPKHPIKWGAFLCHKRSSPDPRYIFRGKKFPENRWVNFPWERRDRK